MLLCNAKYAKLLIIINIMLLLILPQLNNIHYDPLPQFYSEIIFSCLAISLFILIIFTFKRVCIPKISVGIIFFALFIFIQQFVVKISFIGISYTLILELFICLLLAISINTIIFYYGLSYIFKYICIALLIGGIIQSLIGFMQYTGLYTNFGAWIFYDESHPTTNIFGHFGQRNHYCHYLSWSFFALIYLQYIKKIPTYLYLLCATWLSFSITIGASRSVFIYFILATIISGINLIFQRNKYTIRLFYLILASCIIIFSVEFLYPLLLNTFGDNQSSGLSRIIADTSGAGRREIEWFKAWLTFKEYPYFGIGWAEYAKQSVYLQYLFPNAPLNDGLFTNAHNLILQLLAETGITGTLIAIIGLCYPLYSIIKTAKNTEIIIILCMLSTTFAHSMLEYPLWYIYFLGVFILLLSIDKPLIIISRKYIVSIVFLPIFYLIYLIIINCVVTNKLTQYTDIPENNNKQLNTQIKYLENIIANNGIMAYPALFTLDDYIDEDCINEDNVFTLKQKLFYVTRLVNFHPYPDTLVKQAKLYWNLGQHGIAKKIAYNAVLAFPVYKASFLNELQGNKYNELYKIVNQYKYENAK